MRIIQLRFLALLLIVSSACTLQSCSKSGANATGTGRGIVVDIDGDHGMITIDHGEVGKLMQPIMMAYRVTEAKMLAGLAPHDSVLFTLEEKAPGDLYVTQISKIGEGTGITPIEHDSIVTDGTDVRIDTNSVPQ